MGVDHLPAGQHHTDGVHPPMNVALATPLFVLGGVFVILFVGRLAITLHRRRRLRAILKDENQSRFTERNGFMAWINKHVLHAPLLSTRHSREFNLGGIHMGNLPLRIETMLLTGYLGINVAFFVCLIDWWEDYEELMYQLKYAAGHLAVMNTPALVLTAGRNNPLIPLLGIQFDAFNLLHRWVGRLAVVGAVVHVACVIASKTAEVGEKTTQHIFHVPFYIYGLVAFLAFLLIAVQSISPLRHAFYEAFLHFHILLAVAAFVGLWYHLRNLAMQWVLLGTIVLWGLERAARLGSLIWRNWGKQRTIADVEVLPGNVARVNVALTRTWKFKSGQYMYLYIPSLGLWTSHPFSVAWTATEETSVADKADSNDSFNMLLNEKPPRTTVSFLIKRRDGFTCKLLRKAIDSEACRFTATAFAEGPFGGLHSLSSYGTVMLIAGGIGITHPMSYMHEFMEGYSARTVAIRRVNLIWVVRSLDHLTWIQPWMTSLFTHPAVHTKEQHPFQFKGLGVSIHIYVTDRQCSEEYMADKSDSPWAFSAPPGVQVSIGFGKPCFEHIVGKESDSQVGAMAVNVCGPGGMGDDVRKAVRMVQGRKTVDLYEETFSW